MKCEVCNDNLLEEDLTYEEVLWCRRCIKAENDRSIKEDSLGRVGHYKRPPRFAIERKDYKRFGYSNRFDWILNSEEETHVCSRREAIKATRAKRNESKRA